MMSGEDRDPVRLFEGLDTPGVSEAMDKLGLPAHCFGIAPLDNYRKAIFRSMLQACVAGH